MVPVVAALTPKTGVALKDGSADAPVPYRTVPAAGATNVKTLEPSATATVWAIGLATPVPPLAAATIPVTLEAVPVVLAALLGISCEHSARKAGTVNPPVHAPPKNVLTLWVFIVNEIAGVVVAVATLAVIKAGAVGKLTLVT
jgi:hypothetical protein